MEFKAMTAEEVRQVRSKVANNKAADFIDEFCESGMAAAEIKFEPNEYRNANACYNTVRAAAIKARKNNLMFFTRKGHVYVVNTLKCNIE